MESSRLPCVVTACLSLLFLVDCASTAAHLEDTPAGTSAGGGLDRSMVSLCERVAAGDRNAEVALAEHPLVAKMAEGQRAQVGYSPAEFAAAAFGPKEDPRFSWGRLRKNREHLKPFAAALQARSANLIAE